MAKNPLKVARLRIYPVKALEGMDVEAWDLDASGLRLDRRWMVVDASGRCLTRAEYPALAAVKAEIDGDRLVLTAPHEPSLELAADPDPGPTDPATIGGESLAVREVSDDASRWLSKWLKAACRLVFLQESRLRTVDPALGTRKSALAFQDELPLQLATAGSIEDLNGRIAQALGVEAVRPNLVIEGVSPYDEDTWRRIRVGDVEIGIVKPWPRRALVSPDDQAAGPAALAALGERTVDGAVCFGQLAIPATTAGQLRLGDAVEVLERGDPPSFGDAEPEGEIPTIEDEEAEVAAEEGRSRGGKGGGKRVRLVRLPGQRKAKDPESPTGPDPWEVPATAKEEPGREEAPAQETAPAAAAEEERPAPAAEEEQPAPGAEEERPAPGAEEERPAPGAEEEQPAPAREEPAAAEAPEELPVETPAVEEPVAARPADVEVEVTTDRTPDLGEAERLLAAAAVAEGKAAIRKLAEASLAAPVLVTAWQGDALVGLLRGWTDGVRDGFIADVAVHPDQHGSGAAQALVERVVTLHPDIRWVLRASPGSAYLGSALEWQHAGSGWYLSPR